MKRLWYLLILGLIMVSLMTYFFYNKNQTDDLNMWRLSDLGGDQPVEAQPLLTNDSNNVSERLETPEEKKPKQYSFPGILPADKIHNKQAIVVTDKGDIVINLLDDDAPLTVSNFVYLAEADFYDNLTFHRVEPRFVVQGGDPNGNGTGGPGYQFPDESVKLDYKRGLVAMANAGPNTNGSQFFIVLEDQPTLPKNYTIFGSVMSGMKLVDEISAGDTIRNIIIK